MEFQAINFIKFLLINIIYAEAIEEHVIDPNGADQVPWLVFIAKCPEGRLSFDHYWGTLIHDQAVLAANEMSYTDTADLMVFTNCNVRYYQTSSCIPEIVDKIIRIDGKVVLLILKKPLESINPEYDIIKFAIGANNNNEDCYIPFIDYFHEYNNFGTTSVHIKTLYKVKIVNSTIVMIRGENGSPIDRYGRSYHRFTRTIIPEDGFPVVCRGSYNKYLMVKIFSSMGTEFNEMRDYFNSPTDIWITRNLKRKIDAVLDSNGLKRNCLRNLACTGDF